MYTRRQFRPHGGDNLPWARGDTPTEEVQKCFQFAKQILA